MPPSGQSTAASFSERPRAAIALITRLTFTAPARQPDSQLYIEVMRALSRVDQPFFLQTKATARLIRVSIICQANQAAYLETLIRGVASSWAIETADIEPHQSAENQMHLVAMITRSEATAWNPLRTIDSFSFDPISALLEAAQPLRDNEEMEILLKVRRAPEERKAQADKDLTEPLLPASLGHIVTDLIWGAPRVPKVGGHLYQLIQERLHGPAFDLVATVQVSGTDRHQLQSKARSLSSVVANLSDAGHGGLQLTDWRPSTGTERLSFNWRESQRSFVITVQELASLWHPASGAVLVPGVRHVSIQSVPLPPQLLTATGPILGTHQQRGQDLDVPLPQRALHYGPLIVLGETGQGKTTLNHNLLAYFASQPDRPAIVILDPHGTFATDFALRSIPADREQDVVLLELGDPEWPVSMPLFQQHPRLSRDAHVSTAFATFKTLFSSNWSDSKMEDTAFALTATLCSIPSSSLWDVQRLVGDGPFRRSVIGRISDPYLVNWWSRFESLSASGAEAAVGPILTRLAKLYRSEPMRNMLCQRGGPDLMALLDRGGIVLVSLAGPAIEAEANLLGELIIAEVTMTLLARLSRQGHSYKRVYFATEESQRFKGGSLPKLSAEGRKTALTLMLSTQFLSGWSELLESAVLGNIGTLIAFKCGINDAPKLAQILTPFTADELISLNRHQAVAKLKLDDGMTLPAFDLRTKAVESPPNPEMLDRIRQQSRQLYARPRAVVQAELSRSMFGQTEPSVRVHQDIDEE